MSFAESIENIGRKAGRGDPDRLKEEKTQPRQSRGETNCRRKRRDGCWAPKKVPADVPARSSARVLLQSSCHSNCQRRGSSERSRNKSELIKRTGADGDYELSVL